MISAGAIQTPRSMARPLRNYSMIHFERLGEHQPRFQDESNRRLGRPETWGVLMCLPDMARNNCKKHKFQNPLQTRPATKPRKHKTLSSLRNMLDKSKERNTVTNTTSKPNQIQFSRPASEPKSKPKTTNLVVEHSVRTQIRSPNYNSELESESSDSKEKTRI